MLCWCVVNIVLFMFYFTGRDCGGETGLFVRIEGVRIVTVV